MPVLPPHRPLRRRVVTPYVLLWVAAAGFAAAYLTLLGMRPDLFAKSGNAGPDIAKQVVETKRDMTRALADLDPLRRTVGEMKLDVANLKVAAKDTRSRQDELTERVAALESTAPTGQKVARAGETDATAAAVPPPPAPTRNPKKAAAKAKTTASVPASTGGKVQKAAAKTKTSATVPPLAGVKPKKAQARLINAAPKSASAIETGSISRAAKAKPKAPAKAKRAAVKRAPVGVILATGASVDSLRLNWSILTDRHADAVRNLHPRYTISGKAKNRTYSLVAGPVASTAQAKSLCKAIEQQGVACKVSTFRGNAL